MSDDATFNPAWGAASRIEGSTAIDNLFLFLGMVQHDKVSYLNIIKKLEARQTTLVRHLKEWTEQELVSCFSALDLARAPQLYVGVIAAAIQHEFTKTSRAGGSNQNAAAQRRMSGSGAMAACTKVVSTNFTATSWTPDGRVFAGLPRVGEQKFLSTDQEHLFLDRLVLAAHAHSEPSLGDYIPDGCAKVLAGLYVQLLPPFAPSKKGDERPAAKVISHRFQNGRQLLYKRMVLSNEFFDAIGEKTRQLVVFVEPGDLRLLNNERNKFLAELLAVSRKEKPVCALEFCPIPFPVHKYASLPLTTGSTSLTSRPLAPLQAMELKLPGMSRKESNQDMDSSPPPPKEPSVPPVQQPVADVDDDGCDADNIDGTWFSAAGSQEEATIPPDLPPAKNMPSDGDGLSKKAKLLAKKAAAKKAPAKNAPAKKAAGGAKKRKRKQVDSSSEEVSWP